MYLLLNKFLQTWTMCEALYQIQGAQKSQEPALVSGLQSN